MNPIIGPDWLGDRLADIVVCHVGTTMTGADPYRTYLGGHLPGARYVSLDDALAGPPAPVVGRHPLPSPEEFAATLSAIGVDEHATVVAYDDRGGAFAARLVWMLRIIGQPAAVLDGGIAAWPHALEAGPVATTPVDRTPVPWPAGALADSDAVQTHLDAGGIVVDSRDAARYRGEVEPIDAVAGHVPGAVNLPFADNLVDGRFRPASELADRFAMIAADDDPIVYCGSGVTACHNALAIEAAGRSLPRVYVGSWSGWSTEPGRPVARG